MDDEEKILFEDYTRQVKWLRERVPPDDIYDFAQQILMSAETFLYELGTHVDLDKLMETDECLKERMNAVMNIHFLKMSGFKGTLNTSIGFRKR